MNLIKIKIKIKTLLLFLILGIQATLVGFSSQTKEEASSTTEEKLPDCLQEMLDQKKFSKFTVINGKDGKKYYYASFNRQFAGCRDCPAGRYFFDETCEKVAWSQVGIKTESYTKPGFGFLWGNVPPDTKEDTPKRKIVVIQESSQFIVFPKTVRYNVVKQINEIPPFKVKDVLEISHRIGMKQFTGKKLKNHYKPIPLRIKVNANEKKESLLYYLETENKAFIVRKKADKTEWLFTKAYLERHQLPKTFVEEEWEVCYELKEATIKAKPKTKIK